MEDVLLTVFAIIVSLIIFSIPAVILVSAIHGIVRKKWKISGFRGFYDDDTKSNPRIGVVSDCHVSTYDPLVDDPAYHSLGCNIFHHERRD